MTSNNKTNRTVEKNMDRIMELLSKLRFYGMLETYRNDCRTTSSDGMTNDEFLKWLLESEFYKRRTEYFYHRKLWNRQKLYSFSNRI